VESGQGYLSGYEPKSVIEQIAILRNLFPWLGKADMKIAERELPVGAEGWFAVARWQDFAPTYGEAVYNLLKTLRRSRKYYDWLGVRLKDPQHYHLSRSSEQAMQRLGEEQEGYGLLILPAQFGLRHRGRSVSRVRSLLAENEFGLDVFTVTVMLLTHPQRFQHRDDLGIDCPGNEYSPNADDRYCQAPSFNYNGEGRIAFGTRDILGTAHEFIGAATGFLG
jgi:hypothetical protein